MVANGLEGVPWMIGGGQAKHSANLGRVVAYAATGVVGGVIGPDDLRVSPSSTPDRYVHVGTGALAIRNRHGNADCESYVARAVDVSDVQLSLPGGSPRSDLIVARIKDPQYGWAAPADLANGPYAFPEVIPGVPANTTRAEQLNLNQALYALARVDWPANATAITKGMIKNLRRLARPNFWSDAEVQTGVPAAGGEGYPLLTTDTAWKDWPLNVKRSEVPIWATKAVVNITINNTHVSGPADFNSRIKFGNLLGTRESMFDYNGNQGTPVGYVEHLTHATVDTFDVRSLAGQTVDVRLQARRTYETVNKGWVAVGSWEQVTFDIRYYEDVVE